MTIASRLARLERNAPPVRPADGKCDWPNFTVILHDDAPMPDDPPVCPQCGQPHVLHLETVIVTAPGESDGEPESVGEA